MGKRVSKIALARKQHRQVQDATAKYKVFEQKASNAKIWSIESHGLDEDGQRKMESNISIDTCQLLFRNMLRWHIRVIIYCEYPFGDAENIEAHIISDYCKFNELNGIYEKVRDDLEKKANPKCVVDRAWIARVVTPEYKKEIDAEWEESKKDGRRHEAYKEKVPLRQDEFTELTEWLAYAELKEAANG